MGLSNNSIDALLKDWWEDSSPSTLKEIRYIGDNNDGDVMYVAHVYIDDISEDVLVIRNFISKEVFKNFIVKSLS